MSERDLDRRRPLPTLLALAGWIALSLGAGAVGAVASVSARDFFQDLVRPGWAPPASLFGPVWTVLYVLMGTAAWLVWREGPRRDVSRALVLFIVQLVFNALWTWLFFAWRQGGLALLEILVLWALILGTIALFWRIHRISAVLLVPYLVWVTYAAALTAALWRANAGVL
jgi:translocator protein